MRQDASFRQHRGHGSQEPQEKIQVEGASRQAAPARSSRRARRCSAGRLTISHLRSHEARRGGDCRSRRGTVRDTLGLCLKPTRNLGFLDFPFSGSFAADFCRSKPGSRVATLVVSERGYGVPRGFKGEKSKSPLISQAQRSAFPAQCYIPHRNYGKQILLFILQKTAYN